MGLCRLGLVVLVANALAGASAPPRVLKKAVHQEECNIQISISSTCLPVKRDYDCVEFMNTHYQGCTNFADCAGNCSTPGSLPNQQSTLKNPRYRLGHGLNSIIEVALAAYINPSSSPDDWTRMIAYNTSQLSVLVANVLNGPDTAVDNDWTKVINSAIGSGKTVIGYVRTGYLGISEQNFTTRLGFQSLSAWTAQVEQDVDMWYKLYPNITGIFFDEVWNLCGDRNMYSELYRFISDYTKRKYPGAYTVLNPGATVPQCFEHSADTLVTFEGTYGTYSSGYVDID